MPFYTLWIYFFRHGLHENWNTITIFILHLAVCDLLYCSVILPFYAHVYLGNEWKFGGNWCVMSSILAFLFSYADWMALSLIALSRALSLYGPSFFYDHWTINKSRAAMVFVWVLVVAIMMPSFLEVNSRDLYNWNCVFTMQTVIIFRG